MYIILKLRGCRGSRIGHCGSGRAEKRLIMSNRKAFEINSKKIGCTKKLRQSQGGGDCGRNSMNSELNASPFHIGRYACSRLQNPKKSGKIVGNRSIHTIHGWLYHYLTYLYYPLPQTITSFLLKLG